LHKSTAFYRWLQHRRLQHRKLRVLELGFHKDKDDWRQLRDCCGEDDNRWRKHTAEGQESKAAVCKALQEPLEDKVQGGGSLLFQVYAAPLFSRACIALHLCGKSAAGSAAAAFIVGQQW
jgi:hypothetical protein